MTDSILQQDTLHDRALLYFGDCLHIMPHMTCIDQVDMLIADPPYSSGGLNIGDKILPTSVKYKNSGYGKSFHHPEFQQDTRDQHSLFIWTSLWLSSARRLMKKNRHYIMIFTDWRQLAVIVDAIQVAGVIMRGIIPWNKTLSVRPQFGRFRNQCEYIVWGSFCQLSMDKTAPVCPGFFECRVNPREKLHIAGKPVELMRSMMEILPDNSTVFDPFMGSASSGVAAIQQGHDYIGIEVDRHFYDLSYERLQGELDYNADLLESNVSQTRLL